MVNGCELSSIHHLPLTYMSLDDKQSENLFAYGTLQQEAVQLSTFGRKLDGQPDTLVGYVLRMIEIQDQEFVITSGTAIHRNLQFTGKPSDGVEGTVFKVTQNELEQSDAYEPEGYKRVLVQTKSGLNAWVYLDAQFSP
jgi:Gamma-glutamyl cyclotransferase, AIG2-like